MHLTFIKRSGKYDDLRVERTGRPPESIACPKQRIIPHDMVHFAVESTLAHRGFLGMLVDGEPVNYRTVGGVPEEAIERLVEVLQAELWGERVPVDELISVYAHACESRGHAAVPVGAADVEAIRARLDALTREWDGLPIGGSMTMDFAR